MSNWPSDDHISRVAHNGECQEPIYEVGETMYRKNPVGAYALYWSGKKWLESARVTNDMLEVVK